jgi:predicted ATP-dependent endonuclease of OLD family
MKLKGFQAQMFRSIIDSGWVDIEPLTVVVGKNEVGKTSLLRALHKLNPFAPDPYVMDNEWPRGRRRERDEKQMVCRAKFELEAPDLAALRKAVGLELPPGVVEFSRDYKGTLHVEVPWTTEVLPRRPASSVLEPIANGIPNPPVAAGEGFRAKFTTLVDATKQAIREGDVARLEALKDEHTRELQSARSASQPQIQQEQQFEGTYAAKIAEAIQSIKGTQTLHQVAINRLAELLPTFIYMSDYRAFTGSAQLDQVLQRKARNQLTEADRTLMTILELSGLSLEKEVEKGNLTDRKQRQLDLDDASATLTRTISDRWGQRKYEVAFRGDGQLFYTFVKDQHDPSLIELEERSKGFQWFFSFDLMFMYETKGTFANCVILLDEPGLHLHPNAQRDLLRRLEEYAANNTLVYTTHLPFMIDLHHPERIRVLSESDEGTRVSADLTTSQPDAKFVLEAALGMSGSSSYLLSRRNLVVEGVDDYWILNELSDLFRRSGRPSLPDDLFITPAGGASEAAYIATLMIGQRLEVAVLLDSDVAGASARDKLVKNWLTRYQSPHAAVLNIGRVIANENDEVAIEDLFPADYYLRFVKDLYARELAAAGVKDLDLKGSDQLCRRVSRAMETHQIPFNKSSVAKRIRSALSKMKTVDELPPETKERADKLLRAITESFQAKAGS